MTKTKYSNDSFIQRCFEELLNSFMNCHARAMTFFKRPLGIMIIDYMYINRGYALS